MSDRFGRPKWASAVVPRSVSLDASRVASFASLHESESCVIAVGVAHTDLRKDATRNALSVKQAKIEKKSKLTISKLKIPPLRRCCDERFVCDNWQGDDGAVSPSGSEKNS